jgi:twitching motility protein PilT
MSSDNNFAAAQSQNDLAGDIPQPEIEVQQRRLTLQDYLHALVKNNGSDLHLQADSAPMLRLDGNARFLDCPPVSAEEVWGFVKEVMPDEQRWAILEKRGAVDISYAMDETSRFRVNVFHSRGKYAMVMRRIITRIPTFEELNLPAGVESLADHQRGIVVVSGTTGSGKTTTLAALVGKINRSRSERIITIEDPVEYQHENVYSLVSQIEVGTDTESYDYALREVVRQDPDVILIGEIRDSFSLSTAFRAADTGHLVFTSVHATNAAMTVERLASLFDPAQRVLQQQQLGMNLLAVCSMRLARRRDGKGRVPVVEILQMTPLVRKHILDGEYDKLKGMAGNREAGGQNFDQHLAELFQKQIIDVAEAKRLATNAEALNMVMRGISAPSR